MRGIDIGLVAYFCLLLPYIAEIKVFLFLQKHLTNFIFYDIMMVLVVLAEKIRKIRFWRRILWHIF